MRLCISVAPGELALRPTAAARTQVRRLLAGVRRCVTLDHLGLRLGLVGRDLRQRPRRPGDEGRQPDVGLLVRLSRNARLALAIAKLALAPFAIIAEVAVVVIARLAVLLRRPLRRGPPFLLTILMLSAVRLLAAVLLAPIGLLATLVALAAILARRGARVALTAMTRAIGTNAAPAPVGEKPSTFCR